MSIELSTSSIISLNCEVMVSSANSALEGIGPDLPHEVGGVDGSIHRAAGKELYQYLIGLPVIGSSNVLGRIRCQVGDCVVTSGFKTKARYIIHTVAPVYSENNSSECLRLLQLCYKNIFLQFSLMSLRSIVIPPLGTGSFGIPIDEAASVACPMLQAADHAGVEIMVSLVRSCEFSIYNRLLDCR